MEHFSCLCCGGNTDTSPWGGIIFSSPSSSSTAPPAAGAPGAPMYARNGGNAMSNMQQQPHHGSNTASTSTVSASSHPVNPIMLIPQNPLPPPVKSESCSSKPQHLQEFQYYPSGRRGRSDGSPSTGDVDAVKAKIIAHPHYPSLLEAYMDCQKVGAPPEVVARLTAVAGDFEARQQTVMSSCDAPNDPELDRFMEAYYDMLVKYREELTRPFQEAMDFFRRVESQLNALTNGSARFLSGNHHHQDVRHDHWVYNSLRPSPDEIPSLPVLETSSSIHVLNWQSNGMRTVAIYFLQTPFMS